MPIRPSIATRRASLVVAAAIAAVASVGCTVYGPTEKLPHKQYDVVESGLDNATFLYYPAERDTRFRWPCRLELYGTGAAVLRTGPSPQVVDSFAHDINDRSWNSFVEERKQFTPAEMREVFQVFVDEGLVPSRNVREEGPALPLLQCAGTIGRNKFVRVTRNRLLSDVFEDFVETNFSSALRRAGGLVR
jgi:hypothetical protein